MVGSREQRLERAEPGDLVEELLDQPLPLGLVERQLGAPATVARGPRSSSCSRSGGSRSIALRSSLSMMRRCSSRLQVVECLRRWLGRERLAVAPLRLAPFVGRGVAVAERITAAPLEKLRHEAASARAPARSDLDRTSGARCVDVARDPGRAARLEERAPSDRASDAGEVVRDRPRDGQPHRLRDDRRS